MRQPMSGRVGARAITAHTSGQAGQEAVAASIAARDEADTTRTASPLTLAADAVYIDTTDMPIDQVVGTVMQLVRRKIDN